MIDAPLNNLEASIMLILENHQGRDMAISRAALVAEVNALEGIEHDERQIRETLKHLITQHGVAIGSCHHGYFMAATPDEIEQVAKYFESYGLSSFFVASRLKKIEMKEYLGQLSMKF